jgi:hypothetical protein
MSSDARLDKYDLLLICLLYICYLPKVSFFLEAILDLVRDEKYRLACRF